MNKYIYLPEQMLDIRAYFLSSSNPQLARQGFRYRSEIFINEKINSIKCRTTATNGFSKFTHTHADLQ